MGAPLDQYEAPWSFSAGRISHEVYSVGRGPDVVVLHELPGMIDQCLDLGIKLAESGFRAHLPLLFGGPGGKSWINARSVKNALGILCIWREIFLFAKNETSPLVDWLRALCRELKQESGRAGVGVIGMCVTGGFALALVADESVLAPVVGQPALPLTSRAAIGLSPGDAEAVRARTAALGSGCVLGLRYSRDRWSPPERFEAIRNLIGAAFRPVEIEGEAHATLTIERHDTAMRETIEFLSRRLGATPA
jgi:dienelactone hydrolase